MSFPNTPGGLPGGIAAGAADGSTPIRGIVLMILAMSTFSVMDGLSKLLTETVPVAQIVWARFVTFPLVALLAGWGVGMATRRILRTERPVLQIGRSLLLLTATSGFVFALQYIQLADGHAIGFAAPLIVTALSVPILGEKVGIRRWLAVIVGFVGVLIVIRPSGTMHWAVALPVLSAFCFALLQIVTRILNRTDDPITSLFYTGAVGAVATSLLLPFHWVTPGWEVAAMLAVVGLLGALGHFLLIKALEQAAASLLQPFSYLQLLTSTAIGYLMFADIPDRWSLVGAAIIVASGLYVFYRQRMRGGT